VWQHAGVLSVFYAIEKDEGGLIRLDRQSIEKINELTRISRERPLTPEEQQQRQALRAAYLAAFRAQTRDMLDNTKVQYPDGSKVALKDVHKEV